MYNYNWYTTQRAASIIDSVDSLSMDGLDTPYITLEKPKYLRANVWNF